jgi:hypothetical protein
MGPRTNRIDFSLFGGLARSVFRTRKGSMKWIHPRVRSDVPAEAYMWVRPILIAIADI